MLGLRFVRGLSLVAASGGHSSSQCGDRSSSRCAGLSLSRPLPLRGTGSRRAGSAVVAHRPSCSVACGIFPDQGSNPCPLHWQADSQPLRHQGSPLRPLLKCHRSKRNILPPHTKHLLITFCLLNLFICLPWTYHYLIYTCFLFLCLSPHWNINSLRQWHFFFHCSSHRG